MESKLLSTPVHTAPVEMPRPQPSGGPVTDAVAEVRQAILVDCQLAPEKYLQEIGMAASGE